MALRKLGWNRIRGIAAGLIALLGMALSAPHEASGAENADLFRRDNLVAWCIVPFDARRRGPEERAEMLRRLGFTHFAYDWREEHIASFDEEMETLQHFGIELDAFWFPGALNREARIILDALRRQKVTTQLWVTMDFGGPAGNAEEQAKKLQQAVDAVRPIAEEAAKIGCSVGLYNHGGWFGEPENQIAILERLKMPNIGIVYNLHHGHAHLDRFAEMLPKMLPHLYALNLNGMTRGGEAKGEQILPLGQGELDLQLLRTIVESGYRGRIGILGHTQDDAEERLRDNLDGLDWLVPQLDGSKPKSERPRPRTMQRTGSAYGAPSLSEPFGRALASGMSVEGNAEFAAPPLTVELRAQLRSAAGFNILAASQTKASGAHWEIFSWPGSGELTVYMPGMEPDHIRAGRGICDGKWHRIAMEHEVSGVRLWLDRELVADQAVRRNDKPAVEGGLAFGRLVEGGIGCEGLIDDVRISRGVREPSARMETPLGRDDRTLGLWNFDDLPHGAPRADAWEVEDPAIRAAMPESYEIPAARTEELTPALSDLAVAPREDWARSHGNAGSTRYSPLAQINRENVKKLEVAWTYHSGDGAGNVQCNPVVVRGIVYAPTAGDRLVAIDGATGRELWSFQAHERPAHRGLVYWPGDAGHAPRIFFNTGEELWSLDAANGKPSEGFGEKGRVATGAVAVAGAIFENTLVLPGLAGDVFGHDVIDGHRLWTFHTIPQAGEFGADTWANHEQGANVWGGMSLDERRGIAYVSTGSPKPNFVGTNHHGSNLFSNCVIAIDARTGRRLWHFQEIRHDIWDMDIPAAPALVTVEREGRRVDALAQVTKLGNTLLLDRMTGKPLFPIKMRRAPTSKLAGERTWPYQPDIGVPEPFARQVFSKDDVTTRSEEAREFVMGRVANARSGWFEPFEEGKPTAYYGIHGGAEWTGASVDPATSRLYVTANEIPWIITVFSPDETPRDPRLPPTAGEKIYQEQCAKCHGPDRIGVGMAPPLQGLKRRTNDAEVEELLAKGRNSMPAATELTDADRQALLDFLFLRDIPAAAPAPSPREPIYTSNGYPKLLDHEGYPGTKPPWGTLNCIDLNSGRIVWKRPLGEYPELAEQGLKETGAENFGGAIVTAGGLVFCAGTPDLKIRAFDKETGNELWSHGLPWGGHAPPATYEAGRRQFVIIAATGGGKLGGATGDAWVAFALPSSG